MGKSYTSGRNTYGVDTKNTASANLTQGDEWANDFHRRLLVKADWPFLHRTRYTDSLAPSSTFTAVAATDLCTTTGDTTFIYTGVQCTVSSTTTLPAGLTANTTYYIIYQSSTTFNLATSLANAIAGTVVDITDTGTGTHTITILPVSRFQPLPYDIEQVESVSVVVSGTRHSPRSAPSRKFWDELHYNTHISDTPEFFWVENGKIGLWPSQSNDGNQIAVHGKIKVRDMSIADYTTGTVDIVTNGSVEITGSSTAWTTPMVGRWIRITHSNTAASSGDGQWYEIVRIESGTVLQIDRPYGGRSLTTGAGAAYIIGDMGLLPEAFQDLPWTYGSWRYWSKEKDIDRRDSFKDLLVDGVSTLFTTYSINDTSMILDSGIDGDIVLNPNLTIRL